MYLSVSGNQGHLRATEELLDLNAKIDVVNAYGNTPLFNALMGTSLELVELLLERGANPLHINHRLSTPLHFVVYGNMSTPDKIEVRIHTLFSSRYTQHVPPVPEYIHDW